MHCPPTILVVEDDPIIGRALCRAVSQKDHNAELVGSCAAARELTDPYAVAIIDIHLPDGNGLDLYEELLAERVVSAAVFFSATTHQREIERARQLGSFVAKSSGVTGVIDAALKAAAEAEPPESKTRASSPRMPVARNTPPGSLNLK